MALGLIAQIKDALETSHRILVVFRSSPPYDGAAAAIALGEVLEKIGKQVEVVGSGWQNAPLNFLPHAAKIKSQLCQTPKLIISIGLSDRTPPGLSYDFKDNQLFIYLTPGKSLNHEQIKTTVSNWPYDAVIVLDCVDLESLGDVFHLHRDLFLQIPIINIDHRPANENFGQYNLVDPRAVATCEVVFDFLREIYPEKISADCSTALLAGLLSKTRNFQAPQVNALTLIKASELLQHGARREEIIENLFANRPLAVLRLWGLALGALKSAPAQGLVWLAVRAEDFLDTGASESDLLGMVEELINQSPTAKIVVVLCESPEHNQTHLINVWVHTHDHYDAKLLAKSFNPAGSKILANFSLSNQSLAVAEVRVIEGIKNILTAVYQV